MSYIPERGDAVWLQFNPQAGHEQAGHRPAIVLSPKAYNEKTGLILCCPVTNQVKKYPFEVQLPDDSGVDGVILADHIKSLDWKARQAKFIAKLPEPTIAEVLGKINSLLKL